MKLYHGCQSAHVDSVMNDIKVTHRGFYMTPDVNIAREYGSKVVCFEVDDFICDVSTINKTGDIQEDLASGIEYVIRTQESLVSFYKNLEDVYVL